MLLDNELTAAKSLICSLSKPAKEQQQNLLELISSIHLSSTKEIEVLPQTIIFWSNCIEAIPSSVNLLYFNLRLFDLTEFIVWNIYCLRYQVAQIYRGLKVWACVQTQFR